jgi:hypothetical protein
MGKAVALRVEMPVTTSVAAVPSVLGPALAAPAGAVSDTASDTPDGIGWLIDAVIFWLVSFVVMAYVEPPTDALVGAWPALATLTTIGATEPESDTRDTATTLKVTVWLAVCAMAAGDPATARMATNARAHRCSCMSARPDEVVSAGALHFDYRYETIVP